MALRQVVAHVTAGDPLSKSRSTRTSFWDPGPVWRLRRTRRRTPATLARRGLRRSGNQPAVPAVAVGRRAHRLGFATLHSQQPYDPASWRAVAAGEPLSWRRRKSAHQNDVAHPPVLTMDRPHRIHNPSRHVGELGGGGRYRPRYNYAPGSGTARLARRPAPSIERARTKLPEPHIGQLAYVSERRPEHRQPAARPRPIKTTGAPTDQPDAPRRPLTGPTVARPRNTAE
jgi:hypothetical protein